MLYDSSSPQLRHPHYGQRRLRTQASTAETATGVRARVRVALFCLTGEGKKMERAISHGVPTEVAMYEQASKLI